MHTNLSSFNTATQVSACYDDVTVPSYEKMCYQVNHLVCSLGEGLYSTVLNTAEDMAVCSDYWPYAYE